MQHFVTDAMAPKAMRLGARKEKPFIPDVFYAISPRSLDFLLHVIAEVDGFLLLFGLGLHLLTIVIGL